MAKFRILVFVLVAILSTVNSVADRNFEALEDEVRRLREIVDTFQAQKNDTADLEARVAQLEEDMGEVQAEVGNLEGGLALLSDEVDEVEDENTFQNERLFQLDEDLDIKDDEINSLEDTAIGLTLQVTDLQNDNAVQDDRLAALELFDVVLEQRVLNLEAVVNGSSNPNITDLTERVEALEGLTAQLLSDVTDLQSSDADIVERLEVLETVIIEPWEACLSPPCDNGATCVDVNIDTFICMCPDRYFGLTCENSYADATFLAALEADDTGNGIYIFQESVINPGGHYDNTSGAYTAPYDGVYLFGVHLQASATSGTIGFHVRVDGTNYYANTWQYGEYKSATVIIQLEAGQVVNVNESSGTTIDGEAGLLRSYFFGYLIDAL